LSRSSWHRLRSTAQAGRLSGFCRF